MSSRYPYCITPSLIALGLFVTSATAHAAEITEAIKGTEVQLEQLPVSQDYQWGEFNLRPQVTFAELWDDNIFATDSDEEDDFVTIISPSLLLASNWERHQLNLRTGAVFSSYAEHNDEGTQDAWFDIEGRYDVSKPTNLFGGIGYNREHEDRTSPDDVNGIEPTTYHVMRSHAGLYHESGPFTIRAGGTYDALDYDDVDTLISGNINNDDRDRDLYSLGARIGYRYSPKYESFVQLATDTRNYDEPLDNNLQNRESDGYRAGVGLLINDGKRLSGELSLGHIKQDYDDSSLADVSSLDFGAALIWRASPSTAMRFGLDRTLEETTLLNASSYLYTAVDLTVQHKVAPRTVLTGNLTISESDYQGISRNDDMYGLSVGLQHEIARHLYVEGSYRYAQRNSNITGEDFERNQLLFQLRADIAPDFAGGPLLFAAAAPSGDEISVDVSGFYLGGLLGVNALNTSLVGPRGAPGGTLQSDFGTHGNSNGLFAGYGILLENNWYVGLELEASQADTDWYHERMGGRIFALEQDAKHVIAGRLGYMLGSGNLLYSRFGYVETDFDTTYRDDMGTVYDSGDRVNGYLFGGGVEIPLTNHLFGRIEFAYTDYQDNDIFVGTGDDEFDTSEAVANIGIGWRAQSQHLKNFRHVASEELRGFYAGGRFGYGQVDTAMDAIQGETTGDRAFAADFGDSAATWGVFAGWGTTFKRIYLGVELEAEVAQNDWEHIREPSGRDYSVDKEDSRGAALRLGYILQNGTLLYARYGIVETTFNTIYEKGNNPANYINRDDRQTGDRYGLGAEMALSENLFARAEYTYTDYDSYSFATTNTEPDNVRWENSESLFSFGVGWRF